MNASLRKLRLGPVLAAGSVITTALIAFGCSEPAPIIARGAWAVQFVDTGVDCQIANHNVGVGEVSADKRTTLVDDETNDTTVGCTVIDNGGSFYFDAAESNKAGNVLTIVVSDLPSGATKDNPATGTVSYRSSNTQAQFSSTECIFYFKEGTGQSVKAGNIWVTFECPEIAAGIDNVCQIQVGYAAFENCSSKEEE